MTRPAALAAIALLPLTAPAARARNDAGFTGGPWRPPGRST